MELQRIYRTSFEMSHIIKDHPVCGINHGHSYQLTVSLKGDSETWLDFHDIKKLIQTEIDTKYDHKVDPMTKQIYEISAEELAVKIADYLKFNGYSGTLELYETSKYGVKLNF
jgi:6-pyruvoyl-tetrahydropterin synthase